jgi:RNA polymerase sigma factor (sigma-70 family)
MPDYKELNDAELIAKCLRQDGEAWEILVRRYQRLISSITYKFKLSAEDSADIFQAVCLILFQQMSGLKPDAKLSSWLITVTVRECWKLRERNKKTEGMDDDALDHASEIPDQQHHLIEEGIAECTMSRSGRATFLSGNSRHLCRNQPSIGDAGRQHWRHPSALSGKIKRRIKKNRFFLSDYVFFTYVQDTHILQALKIIFRPS